LPWQWFEVRLPNQPARPNNFFRSCCEFIGLTPFYFAFFANFSMAIAKKSKLYGLNQAKFKEL
jgi:hypothetical protein